MSPQLILQPVVAMLLLTAAVWIVLYALRIPAMHKLGLPVQTWTSPDKTVEHLPPAVNYPAYNFRNLFEMPVVFYVVCLVTYVTGTVDGIYVAAAWTFVALRVLHSLIHITINRVLARFLSYLAASLVLWFMLGRVAVNVLL